MGGRKVVNVWKLRRNDIFRNDIDKILRKDSMVECLLFLCPFTFSDEPPFFPQENVMMAGLNPLEDR
jgi:hypothetical protein